MVQKSTLSPDIALKILLFYLTHIKTLNSNANIEQLDLSLCEADQLYSSSR